MSFFGRDFTNSRFNSRLGRNLCGDAYASLWTPSCSVLDSGTFMDEASAPNSSSHAFKVICFGFLIGCTFAPNLSTFAGLYFLFVANSSTDYCFHAAMRCLNGFFA